MGGGDEEEEEEEDDDNNGISREDQWHEVNNRCT